MPAECEIASVLRNHLANPSSSFSIGSFGAIAEFHRHADEPLTIDDPKTLTIATALGGLKITLAEGIRPVAYETLSSDKDRWGHGVVFCLPKARAVSRGRTTLSELGPDRAAIRAGDRDSILFDIGLDARNIEFCVRTDDPNLIDRLRQETGRSVLRPECPVMNWVVDASPHRIAISKLGRVEVYQPISRVKTPEGPHTHVLPKLLASGRTHSANVPVPDDTLPCLNLYPDNPVFDSLGQGKPYESESHAAFDTLFAQWGPRESRAEKARAIAAVEQGGDPSTYDPPRTRLGRTALRVGLRQLRQTCRDQGKVSSWLKFFDAPGTAIET